MGLRFPFPGPFLLPMLLPDGYGTSRRASSCPPSLRHLTHSPPFALREMLEYDGPFLLDVMVPHVEHVLPMIPGGGSFKDIITQGDGSQDSY